MVLEVGKGKVQEAAKEKKHQENRVRLNERIKHFGMKEKREIPGTYLDLDYLKLLRRWKLPVL
jgi:hypothetical protein